MGNLVSVRNVSIFGVFLAVLALAAFLIASQLSLTVIADDDDGEIEDFVGFWMAVDPTDGGSMNLSISDNDGDGSAEIGLAEDYVSTCVGGPALINGSGSINEGNLEAQLTIQCLEDTTNDPKGDPVGPIPVVFEAIEKNIIELTVPVIPDFTPISFHRVSENK